MSSARSTGFGSKEGSPTQWLRIFFSMEPAEMFSLINAMEIFYIFGVFVEVFMKERKIFMLVFLRSSVQVDELHSIGRSWCVWVSRNVFGRCWMIFSQIQLEDRIFSSMVSAEVFCNTLECMSSYCYIGKVCF